MNVQKCITSKNNTLCGTLSTCESRINHEAWVLKDARMQIAAHTLFDYAKLLRITEKKVYAAKTPRALQEAAHFLPDSGDLDELCEALEKLGGTRSLNVLNVVMKTVSLAKDRIGVLSLKWSIAIDKQKKEQAAAIARAKKQKREEKAKELREAKERAKKLKAEGKTNGQNAPSIIPQVMAETITEEQYEDNHNAD